MKIQHVLSVGLLLSGSVWAQPSGEGAAAGEHQDPRGQLRAELRQALQPSQAPVPGTAAPATPRQLSPQERKALREQLRQQRPPPGAARARP